MLTAIHTSGDPPPSGTSHRNEDGSLTEKQKSALAKLQVIQQRTAKQERQLLFLNATPSQLAELLGQPTPAHPPAAAPPAPAPPAPAPSAKPAPLPVVAHNERWAPSWDEEDVVARPAYGYTNGVARKHPQSPAAAAKAGMSREARRELTKRKLAEEATAAARGSAAKRPRR